MPLREFPWLGQIMALDPSCCGPTAPGPDDLVIHHRNYRAELTEEQYKKLIFKASSATGLYVC